MTRHQIQDKTTNNCKRRWLTEPDSWLWWFFWIQCQQSTLLASLFHIACRLPTSLQIGIGIRRASIHVFARGFAWHGSVGGSGRNLASAVGTSRISILTTTICILAASGVSSSDVWSLTLPSCVSGYIALLSRFACHLRSWDSAFSRKRLIRIVDYLSR